MGRRSNAIDRWIKALRSIDRKKAAQSNQDQGGFFVGAISRRSFKAKIMSASSQEIANILAEFGNAQSAAERQRTGLSMSSAIEILQIIRKDQLIAALTALTATQQAILAKMP
jgi:hypothetical protein